MSVAICAQPRGSMSFGCDLGQVVGGETSGYYFISKVFLPLGGHVTAHYTWPCAFVGLILPLSFYSFLIKQLCFYVAKICPLLTCGLYVHKSKGTQWSGDDTLAFVYLKAPIINVAGSDY